MGAGNTYPVGDDDGVADLGLGLVEREPCVSESVVSRIHAAWIARSRTTPEDVGFGEAPLSELPAVQDAPGDQDEPEQ
jgi:hypothetical protein